MNNVSISIGNSTIFDEKLKSDKTSDKTVDTDRNKETSVINVNSMKLSQNGASYFINGFNRNK